MAPAGAAALACQPMAPTTAMDAVMAAAMMKLRMCFPSLDEWKPKVRILSLRAPSRCDYLAANTASHWTATKRGRVLLSRQFRRLRNGMVLDALSPSQKYQNCIFGPQSAARRTPQKRLALAGFIR
jgi:hypothetical protein